MMWDEEKEEHERTHIPFRAWCPMCVKGKAKNAPHTKEKEKEKSAIPGVSMDYAYMLDTDEVYTELESYVQCASNVLTHMK